VSEIALPTKIVDRGVTLDLQAIRPEVLFRCLVLGLRARAWDYHMLQEPAGHAPGATAAVLAVFEQVREPAEGEVGETFLVELPPIEATAIFDQTDPILRLDLANVPLITRQRLLIDGIGFVPVAELPDRLLGDNVVLPGET
jgi:hypothetical protein